MEMVVVDSHVHLYSPDEAKYPSIKDPLRPPLGTGSLVHLQDEMKNNGVSHAVIVQTSSFYRIPTLSLVRSYSRIMCKNIIFEVCVALHPQNLDMILQEFDGSGKRRMTWESW
jgi:Tat protein secretion system quality control protein TatD with DNase activity